MKTPSLPLFLSLVVYVTSMWGDAIAAPPSKETGETDESAVATIDLDTASREIEKLNGKVFDLGLLEAGGKPVVSEYEIRGLREELGMQLFRAARDDKPMTAHLVFLYADGKLNRLQIPTHGSAGLLDAAVIDGSLYLTSDWGSGILRTALYRVHRDKEGEIQTQEMGVLSSSPEGLVDKEFIEDEKVVKITKALRPLRPAKKRAGRGGA